VCQEVVDEEIDIFSLPVMKCWPYDGGRFVTLPMVNTIDPETGIRNVGMYSIQLLDSKTTAMHWHLHKTGARHYQQYKKLGRRMPCAIVLGGDPVYAYCATAPLPDGIDEYLLAGFLRGKAVNLVKCLTQPEIYVPEDADFVIEGYVDPQEELVLEGPFGDHTGFYSLADYYPKFHITCITHRKDAVYPATIVGVPPMEDAYISMATEKIFRFPITMAFAPEMLDLNMPLAGVEHNLTLVKIKNQYPGNALKIKNAMWGAGQMMFNKILCVYDGDRELTDYQEFLKDALKNFSPERDVYI
jgi:4-hydroxy-3-polyprenylbenzoate decarboxylase